MLYISTRGRSQAGNSASAIVEGLAEDGGLYVPVEIPSIAENFNELVPMEYRETALSIMKRFFEDFSDEELMNCINKAYT